MVGFGKDPFQGAACLLLLHFLRIAHRAAGAAGVATAVGFVAVVVVDAAGNLAQLLLVEPGDGFLVKVEGIYFFLFHDSWLVLVKTYFW
ncbi:MAG: hypothetical protein AVDCRST_MAG56-4018 [uncultured Cytophagales bacterium]|uniref:Uncharacterized protein n=1 Tax=uncultured Cytophagales bacterium TaxID=158755 RepID=A0A6J4JNI6_9SPHI|nr:MAG: hypothetical protein AVDCRST_MAG56-4018 [uncultured Cytophagales bacterium]